MVKCSLDVKIVGRGPDLVLLNSLLSDRTAYDALIPLLSGRRLVLANLPGFGASPRVGSELGDLADSVARLFADLGLPATTDVLGNGLGGFVGLALAMRHGEKFRRLVLVGGAVAFPEAGRATFRALADRVEREGMAAVADAAVKRMLPDPFIAANPAVAAERKAVFMHIPPETFAASCRMLARLDLSADLDRVRNPTLIVVGGNDAATPPALGRDLAHRLSDAEAVEIPGTGHCPHIQDPHAFLAAVAPFLGLATA